MSAAPGCAQIAGLNGDYTHATSGGTGAQGGAAGLGGSAGTSGGTPADSGTSGDVGTAGNDTGGTGGTGDGTGGTSAGKGGSGAGKGGTSTGTGGDAGAQGGEPSGTGASAGVSGSAGTSGSAGQGGSFTGPVRIGYSEFHDSDSGSDDASAHLVDATFEMPAGTREGDFILVFFGVDHQLNITNSDSMMQGWTLVDAEEAKGDDGQGTYLLYRFAGANEPASIVFEGVNENLYGVQGLLTVYRGVNRMQPVNDYNVVVVDHGTDGPTHIDTPTPAITTTSPNCLLLAGLSPDSAVDAPVVTSWPEGFGNELSVNNLKFPRPYGWANIYLAERPWNAAATFPASSFGWDFATGTVYYGAVSFVLALAPGP